MRTVGIQAPRSRVAAQAQQTISLDGAFYAGKHVVHGSDLFDVSAWGADSFDRFQKHRRAGKAFRFAAVLALFRGHRRRRGAALPRAARLSPKDQGAALDAERAVQEELTARTGLRSLHGAYQRGPLSLSGDGWVVYLLLR